METFLKEKELGKKIMISQPMHGFTEEQIVETRNRFLQFAEKENLEVVNTYFQDEWYSKEAMTERGVVQIPLCFLASINKVSIKFLCQSSFSFTILLMPNSFKIYHLL